MINNYKISVIILSITIVILCIIVGLTFIKPKEKYEE